MKTHTKETRELLISKILFIIFMVLKKLLVGSFKSKMLLDSISTRITINF